MVQEMVKQQVKATKDRKHVPEHRVESLLASSAISKAGDGVKILGNGEVTKKLTVKANAFSESAKAKIEAAGGTVEVI